MEPVVRVDGLGKLLKQIKEIEPDLVDELKGANREIAEDVVGTARFLVPVVSGRLRKSIRAAGTARTGIVRAGRSTVPWAGPIHFGWARRNIHPNPFLYEALDQRADEVVDRYMKALDKATKGI